MHWTLETDLGDKVRRHWKGVLHLYQHGQSNLFTLTPSTIPGSHPDWRPSVVWEVLGLGYKGQKAKGKGRMGPSRGLTGKLLTFLGKGSLAGSLFRLQILTEK